VRFTTPQENIILASKLKLLAAAMATVGLLAACGGGGGADTTPKAKVTSVKVMGDSLSDSGTFGYKFTVQGNDPTTGKPYLVWPERIADLYSTSLCAHYKPTSQTTFVTANAGCTNYAIGGGVINGAGSGLTAADPRIIGVQLATATAAGNFGANDLLLVVGGGNDAATLVGAYLRAATDGGPAYLGVLGTLLTPAQVAAAAGGGAAGLGGRRRHDGARNCRSGGDQSQGVRGDRADQSATRDRGAARVDASSFRVGGHGGGIPEHHGL
jgi:hypothetical protein